MASLSSAPWCRRPGQWSKLVPGVKRIFVALDKDPRLKLLRIFAAWFPGANLGWAQRMDKKAWTVSTTCLTEQALCKVLIWGVWLPFQHQGSPLWFSLCKVMMQFFAPKVVSSRLELFSSVQYEQRTSQECCLARGCDAFGCWQCYTSGYDTPTVTGPIIKVMTSWWEIEFNLRRGSVKMSLWLLSVYCCSVTRPKTCSAYKQKGFTDYFSIVLPFCPPPLLVILKIYPGLPKSCWFLYFLCLISNNNCSAGKLQPWWELWICCGQLVCPGASVSPWCLSYGALLVLTPKQEKEWAAIT